MQERIWKYSGVSKGEECSEKSEVKIGDKQGCEENGDVLAESQ